MTLQLVSPVYESRRLSFFPNDDFRYRHHLIDSLRLDKLRHWDPELRRLSALALGRMAPLEPEYVADTVLKAALADTLSPDLLRRHGACLAASEIALALGKVRRQE